MKSFRSFLSYARLPARTSSESMLLLLLLVSSWESLRIDGANCPDITTTSGANTIVCGPPLTNGAPSCTGTCTAGAPCYVRCTSYRSCASDVMSYCTGASSCMLSCEAEEACRSSTFNCPNGPCQVECKGQIHACADMDINCGNGPCYVECDNTAGAEDACENLDIFGQTGTLSSDASIVLSCTGGAGDQTCNNIDVRCNSVKYCGVICDSTDCNNMDITCTSAGSTCFFSCGGAGAICTSGTRNCGTGGVACGFTGGGCPAVPGGCPLSNPCISTPSLTPSRSVTATRTPSSSHTRTASASPTRTHTATTTPTTTASATKTRTTSPSVTPTHTPTHTPTTTPTTTASVTKTRTASASVTPTRTATVTRTTTPSTTASATKTRTASASVTPTHTATVTPTITPTPSVSTTITPTVTPSLTTTPTTSGTPNSSTSSSPSVTATPTTSVTTTATQTRTTSNTPSPTASITPPTSQSPTSRISESPSATVSTPSVKPSDSASLAPSLSNLFGLTCEGIVCEDNDPCTVEICLEGQCNHQPITCDDFDICTADTCNNGICTHEPISGCASGDCRSIGSCDQCEETTGCAWLQCSRDSSALSNVTTLLINNQTQLNAFYTYVSIPVLEETMEVWFKMNKMTIFFVTQEDYVSLGASQGVFSACLAEDSVNSVANQYDSDVVCERSSDCVFENQLEAQIGTIGTSIGVAGGGGVGCFAGSCLVAVVFYRRKKSNSKLLGMSAVLEKTGDANSFSINDVFEESNSVNPIFEVNNSAV